MGQPANPAKGREYHPRRGLDWDTFESCHGLQLQRVDEPDHRSKPYFSDDDEAAAFVLSMATYPSTEHADILAECRKALREIADSWGEDTQPVGRAVVWLEGGVVELVTADAHVQVTVVDFDTEGADPDVKVSELQSGRAFATEHLPMPWDEESQEAHDAAREADEAAQEAADGE